MTRRLRNLLHPLAAIGFGIVAAVLIVRTQGALALVEAGRPDDALALYAAAGPAHRMAAAAALARRQTRSAHVHALAALAQTPLDQSAATIAALTAREQALTLSNQSAALGWRDPMTQLLLAQGAEAEGAWEIFAQRIDAYARLQPDMAETGKLIDRIVGDPAAREAIARRLVLAPNWRAAYFLTFDPDVPHAATNRVALLRRIVANGGRLSDMDVRENVRRLVAANASGDALTVWRGAHPRPGLLGDERLEQIGVEADTVPFQWSIAAGLRGFATREDVSSGRTALHIRHDGTGTGLMLEQTLVLDPGSYRLEADLAAQPTPGGAVWQIRCLQGQLLGETDATAGRPNMTFAVPAECATQRVALVSSPTANTSGFDLWLARVRITRL